MHPSDDIRIFIKQCSTLVTKGARVTLLANHSKDEIVNGVNIKALRRSSAISRVFINLPIILLFTLKNKFDIYHAHDPELIPILFILRLFGRRVIYDMHENFSKQLKSKNISNNLKLVIGAIWPSIEYITLKKIGVVFAETSYKKDYSYIKNHVDVLNMPLVETLKNLKTDKHDRFTIGYVGGVTEDRYCIKILETLLRLQKNGIDIGFECVGSIPNKSTKLKVDSLIPKLSNVNFYGILPPGDAWKKIIKCHVGIAVLMPKPNYIESYPTKLFEYLAMGMPVITSNFELYKPVVLTKNVGFCIDPLRDEEFESAICELYDNKKLFDEMSVNTSKVFNECYDWNNELKKLTSFYNAF